MNPRVSAYCIIKKYNHFASCKKHQSHCMLCMGPSKHNSRRCRLNRLHCTWDCATQECCFVWVRGIYLCFILKLPAFDPSVRRKYFRMHRWFYWIVWKMSRLSSDFQHAYALQETESVCAMDSQWHKAWAHSVLTET